MVALQADGLTKSVTAGRGEQIGILHGVNLHVPDGSVAAIVGRSGSGKTTLLSILGLLAAPDDGSLVIADTPTRGLSSRAASHLRNTAIGFIFQTYSLVPHLTAQRNVMLPMLYGAGLTHREARHRAAYALDSLGLARLATRHPRELSGGEQQRVAIARAIATRPRILLADEPTGALDESNADAVIAQLVDAARSRGAALVIVTHDDQVAALADRRYLLHGGRLQEAA